MQHPSCRTISVGAAVACSLLAALSLFGCAWGRVDGGGVHLIGCTLTDELRSEFELPAGVRGVLVTHVPARCALEGAGVCAGDVITSVNGEATTDYAAFSDVTFAAGAKQPLLLSVQHGAERSDVTIESLPAERTSVLVLDLLFPFAGRPLVEGGPALERAFYEVGAGFRHPRRPDSDYVNEPATVFDLSLCDFGLGPDLHGFTLLRSLGYESAPGNWVARILCFEFGRSTVIRVASEGKRSAAAAESQARLAH